MEGLGMYGLYWRVQEVLAAQMEGKNPSCSVHYSVTRWSLLLSLRGSLVFSALSRLGVTGLVTVKRDGDDISVRNRNLLKYRDEYSRKSGENQYNVTPRTEGDIDVDKEVETEKTIPPEKPAINSETPVSISQQEEAIYKAYCRKIGKVEAIKAIRKAVERLSHPDGNYLAMDPYGARRFLWKKATDYSSSPAGAKPSGKDKDYRPHPATWFNQGRYLDDPNEWQKSSNGGKNANVSLRPAEGDMAVLAESLSGGKYQRSSYEDGDLSPSEDRQGEPPTLHGDFAPVGGPESLPSGDGDTSGEPEGGRSDRAPITW
jgi:hypothetical protein